MPDLIRHPDVFPTPYQVRGKLQSGTISKTGSRFSPGTLDSGFRRNDALYENRSYGQRINSHGHGHVFYVGGEACGK
jgi:hypothetical protein